ncbi:MAG TPA: immunoglobulin domain-containing protein [Verrucomicrobiae bacterium]|nr:immunoglobulin domain-containing protein [Verrucomicrobiae bacterium]
MKTNYLLKLLSAIGLVCACGFSALAQTNVPSTFKHITIDGSFDDWTGVPLAYTSTNQPANAIQYENVYIANDETNLYIRFTLYSPRAAFQNSYDNIFIDTDNNPATGYSGAGGIGSEMLIQQGTGYQEKGGGFNEGEVNNLGWNIAGSEDSMDYELSISLGATFASDNTPVFPSNTIAILLEGDDTGYNNVEFVPPTGGLVYTFATQPTTLATNTTLITLANSWQANAAGSDLGTNWLGQSYDDTGAGWAAGDGLFGYTPSPGSYPAINTALASGPNTYYFRTHFEYTNDTANIAFVITNYLSDGAVYYLNGNEVRRIRMPGGTVTYATAASATNSPTGHADIFGINGGGLQFGDNILEVETHQAPASSADMVFGLSLAALTSYPVLNVSANLPADQTVLAGGSVTFTSDVIGSGPLTYQWYFNGTTAIAGANGPSYTIPLVLTNNAGTYSLQVSNLISSAVTTRAASLTVSNTPISIVTQPTNQIAVEGRPATFSVGVSGTPLIQYQWYFGANPIPGATNADYVIPDCNPTNAGNYQVTISNPASTTNSVQANLTVLLDTLPPKLTTIAAGANQIVVTFSEPVDTVTAENITKYSISGGVTVLSAVQSSGNPAQVTLTTGVAMNLGTVYTLTVNGVADLFGNLAYVSGQFARVITIDGSFDDWDGVAPVYSSDAPSGNTGAADFKDIYMYDDANNYYFRVTLWTDIDPGSGQFPDYVNLFFDTDDNVATGYGPGALGSDMLIQSGFAYQEKNGNFNDGYGINNLNWFCLPQSPGTNFEFSISKAATFGEDGTPVFTANVINFIFQGMDTSFNVINQVPASGVITYNDNPPLSVAALPLGNLSVSALSGKQAAVVWDPPGILQESSSLTGPWTNLPSATSPYVIPASNGNQFFRLTQ